MYVKNERLRGGGGGGRVQLEDHGSGVVNDRYRRRRASSAILLSSDQPGPVNREVSPTTTTIRRVFHNHAAD